MESAFRTTGISYLQTMTGKPKLRLFDLTMIVVGLVIGMGIFRTSSDAANAAVTPSVFFIAWLAGGLIALCGALTYAEIGSRFPITGGYYKVFAECYHPSIAFSINCIILISNAASMSGVALVGSEYISQVIFKVDVSDTTRAFIEMHVVGSFAFPEGSAQGAVDGAMADYKSALQEMAQALKLPPPRYFIVGEEGPEHYKTFTVEVRVGKQWVGQAQGLSKKAAGQKAAEGILQQLIEWGR